MNYRTCNHKDLTAYSRRARPAALLLAALVTVFALGWQVARAASTQVSTEPVFATTPPATNIKPNVMMVLDDSGSMDWTYMPDDAMKFHCSGDIRYGCGGGATYYQKYGSVSSQCNGMYYNPNIKYAAPVDASGTSFSDQSFTSAAKDGYGLTSGTTNLSTSFKPADTNFSSQAAFYYTYSGNQTADSQKNYYDTSSIFFQECNSTIGSTTNIDGAPVKNHFTYVKVSSTSGPGGTDERTNFANWYSYYSKRINMMKTATGRAFSSLSDDFRVGFMTLHGNSTTQPGFINITDFNTTQKSSFFNSLYASVPKNGTPLRTVLSDVGRMYAGKKTSINGVTVVDPVQYACQQNYTILSTDGKWNDTLTDAGVAVQLDGTTKVGNQDGTMPRPYYDGATVNTSVVTPRTSYYDKTLTRSSGTATKTWTRNETTIGAACSVVNPPSNTASASLKVESTHWAALGNNPSNPDLSGSGTHCKNLGGDVWFCRGSSNSSPAVNAPSAKDSTTGTTWYLVSDISGQPGCISAHDVWNGTYYANAGVCPDQSVTGSYVTVVPYTQTETLSNYVYTQVDRYTAVQTKTDTYQNGVLQTSGSWTPTSPTYDFTSTQSANESYSSTTCGGQPGPCPSSSGTWTAGTALQNNVCTATANLPTAGTSAATASDPVYSALVESTSNGATTAWVNGTATQTDSATGGTANTLADVAAYYYATNLRTTALGNCTGPTISPSTTPNDLCIPNTVPKNGNDNATWQHMSTFTVGLGVRGYMTYSPTYSSDTSGDYYNVAVGNTSTSTSCLWWKNASSTSDPESLTTLGGPCNWPYPNGDQTSTIDDLWHTGVDGRGNYFSAKDPAALASGLKNTLNAIVNTPRAGTASAAATTNPKITSTNNYQFSSYFKTVEWSGELIRQTMNLTDGSVPYYDPFKPDPATYDWSAQTLLDAQSYAARNIFTKGTSGKVPFTWTDLGTAGLQSYFDAPNITLTPPQYPTVLTGLSQFCSTGTDCISATAQANNTVATGGAAGEALVNFLRGDRSNEEGTTTDNTKFYRHRTHVLGDIVSAQPQWVGAPSRYYSDTGYGAYKTLWASRTPVVYTAANDGMLHAFRADTGAELWAYIPSFVLPRLYTLADKNYANLHQYFVEGTPVTGDICPKAPASTCADSEWKTILVGGLNGGGTGYYALDITDPANPQVLWEFTDNNMGYSFGKPQITKLDDGTWVVMLTSGYDNCPRGVAPQENCVKNGTGDGQGYLYVLNAGTGAQVSGSPIATGVGATSDPSGLAQILARADSNNVTRQVYGGDLLGNMWRFSVSTASTFNAHLLANVQDASGAVQPITVRPQVTTVNGFPVVYFGTGRYLGISDVGVTPAPNNSFYAVKDDLGSTTYTNIRSDSSFIGQLATDSTCPAGTDVSICKPGDVVRLVSQTSGTSADNLTNKNGWYLDFPAGAGEIEFTDPKLALGTLAFSTSVPRVGTSEACQAKTAGSEGEAFGYMLDYLTGGAVGTSSGVIGVDLGAGVATAPQIAQLPNGTVIAKYRLSTGQEVGVPLRFGGGGGATKRISWRELISE